MTEKEKMIAGLHFDPADKTLREDRAKSKEAMRHINDLTLKRDERTALIKEVLGTTGIALHIEPTITFDYGYNIHVGENFYANHNSIFLDGCPIRFGDNCMLGPNVQLYTAMHPLNAVERNSGIEFGKPITIGDSAWIGGGAIIVPGVTLGNNVVVAAGSVVTKSFGNNVVIGGNPAKIIKTIEN